MSLICGEFSQAVKELLKEQEKRFNHYLLAPFYTFFKQESITEAVKLKALACTPSELVD